jgi:membrane protein
MSAEGTVDEPVSGRVAVRAVLQGARALGRLARDTTGVCLRYRVTGLAAEAGFFALLSLPPLVLGLVASAGYLGRRLGPGVVQDLQDRVEGFARTFLTESAAQSVIGSTFDEVASDGRLDIMSIGFVLSLWSGSRALNVFIDTVSIMYGQGGRRGIVRTRALSFSMYVASLILGTVLIPLVLIGPGLISAWVKGLIGDGAWQGWLGWTYWIVVVLFSVVALATLYHVATPHRTMWRRDVPGAVLALVIWLLASVILRFVLTHSVDGTSIYGPLATPIVILIWLYALAIAVLIGAALNAALNATIEARRHGHG